MRLILATLMAVAALSGCAAQLVKARQQVSSAHIGCAPDEISIANTGSATWEATCKGKVFYCSVAPSAACTAKMEVRQQ